MAGSINFVDPELHNSGSTKFIDPELHQQNLLIRNYINKIYWSGITSTKFIDPELHNSGLTNFVDPELHNSGREYSHFVCLN